MKYLIWKTTEKFTGKPYDGWISQCNKIKPQTYNSLEDAVRDMRIIQKDNPDVQYKVVNAKTGKVIK